jgi:hypothetical protein
MNENGEMWDAIHKDQQAKRHQNEEQSIKMLQDLGIKYEILSKQSSHYRVGRFNFWPTTGKFYDPKTGEKGRGVRNLINKVKTNERQ